MTLRTPSAMKPQERITSSTPCPCNHSSMYETNGRSTSGTTGLGIVEVSGRRRVPSPPARISACTGLLPSYALVEEPGVAHDARVGEVAPVDDELAAHPPGHVGPIELAELRPLGDDDARIRAGDRVDRGVGELDPDHQLACLLLGDRVIRLDMGPVRLEPRGEHERGGLAHVVGI